ncbi:MAG: hypothetical protein WDN69_05115 [Aliidongia sp.]
MSLFEVLPVAAPEPAGDPMRTEFAIWYRTFPRRKKPADAERAYSKARKIATAAELLAGAERYAEERKGKDPAFTSYPGSWLRARRWLDEPDQAPDPVPVRRRELSDEAMERLRRSVGDYSPPPPTKVQQAKMEAERQERLDRDRAWRARMKSDEEVIEAGRRDFAAWCEERRAAGLPDSYRQYLAENGDRAS